VHDQWCEVRRDPSGQRGGFLGLVRGGIASGVRDVDPNSEISQQEVFGPVLTGPWPSRCGCGCGRGNVTVNGKSHFGITSPFGGTKQSGLGRHNGDEGYREYLEGKTIGMPE